MAVLLKGQAMNKVKKVKKDVRDAEIIDFFLNKTSPEDVNPIGTISEIFSITPNAVREILDTITPDMPVIIFENGKDLFAREFVRLEMLYHAVSASAMAGNLDAVREARAIIKDKVSMLTSGVDRFVNATNNGNEPNIQKKLVSSGSAESDWIVEEMLNDPEYDFINQPEILEKLKDYARTLSESSED